MRIILAVSLLTCCLFAADVSGNWEAQVETNAGAGSPSFVLKQDGEKLTGSYSGALGNAELTGTVKGDVIEFSFEVSPQGDKVKVVYKGKIKNPMSMGGSLVVESLGEGTWTAIKR
ncbi:MAG: hypothetical protein K2X03_09970 [Bryobacteraceae bacterium]|nr:hypothetical protein [Bryobacteraceae bacterium]